MIVTGEDSIEQRMLIQSDSLKDQLEIAPTAPQSPHAGKPIALAVLMASQSPNPQHRLSNRWHGGGVRGPLFMDFGPQGLPFLLAENLSTEGVGAMPGQGFQLDDANRDREKHRQGFLQSRDGFQLQLFRSTPTFQGQMNLFNTPSSLVDFHDAPSILSGFDGFGGPQQPVQGLDVGIRGRLGFPDFHQGVLQGLTPGAFRTIRRLDLHPKGSDFHGGLASGLMLFTRHFDGFCHPHRRLPNPLMGLCFSALAVHHQAIMPAANHGTFAMLNNVLQHFEDIPLPILNMDDPGVFSSPPGRPSPKPSELPACLGPT